MQSIAEFMYAYWGLLGQCNNMCKMKEMKMLTKQRPKRFCKIASENEIVKDKKRQCTTYSVNSFEIL